MTAFETNPIIVRTGAWQRFWNRVFNRTPSEDTVAEETETTDDSEPDPKASDSGESEPPPEANDEESDDDDEEADEVERDEDDETTAVDTAQVILEDEPDDSDRDWIQCLNCKSWEQFRFYNPQTVYCEECGKRVAGTDQPVIADLCALRRPADEIVSTEDPSTVYASVEWDQKRIRRKNE